MDEDGADDNAEMRLQLMRLIDDWNANRLDLFALSEPNEDLEFHGVMRFFYQESGQRMSTKCIRVSSTATTRAVIEALIDKFHADLRLLSTPSYSLWEVHESGEKRKLLPDEKPLLVQLNWHKDDREGRFLLLPERDEPSARLMRFQSNENVSMKRKLSKREQKKLERQKRLGVTREAEDITEMLYVEVPNTNFTRTISNPEVVMKKRRERKLEQKLKELGEGGSLKIYGEELSATKPYITLLLSLRDRADKVIRETLEKYGLDRHSASNFCLVIVRTSSGGKVQERVLDKDDCPLLILAKEGNSGNPTFHVRHVDLGLPLALGAAASHKDDGRSADALPYLQELNSDGSEPSGASRLLVIQNNVTEVGSNRSFGSAGSQAICLCGPSVQPRHCVITLMDGVTTVTPCDAKAEIAVDEMPISQTAILRHGAVLRIGRSHLFRFHDRGGEKMANVQPDTLKPKSAHTAYAPVAVQNASLTPGIDAIPALFEFDTSVLQELLKALILDIEPSKLVFKLSSAYALYMCCRFCVSNGQPDAGDLLTTAVQLIQLAIQEHKADATRLAYWMSNASEVLNFAKLDADLMAITQPEPQESLADVVQKAFDQLAVCLKRDLHAAMPPLLDPQASDQTASEPCRHILTCVMNLLRLSRVNAALTIQLFSQLFHYVNMYLFNWLVRLGSVLCWAEQQGLELAAECRLERVMQAVQLLLATKRADQAEALAGRLTRLNSLQVASLLDRYAGEPGDEVDAQFAHVLLQAAERQVDQALKSDYQPLQLEEEVDLLLPFLIPDDGYSPELVRGLPQGLQDVLSELSARGYGRMVVQQRPTSASWTVHFAATGHAASDEPVGDWKDEEETGRPAVVNVNFEKDVNGIGLSIVHAQASDDQMPGIYVKKVVPGSAAAKDGRLQAGDQLVKVNGHNLVGVTQEYAAKLMSQAGPVVNFEVAKGAALYNGLAQWIYEYSPDTGRSNDGHQRQQQPQKASIPYGGARGMAAHRGPAIAVHPEPQASLRYKKAPSAGGSLRSATASPCHLMSRSAMAGHLGQQQHQPPPKGHRYSTSDIYQGATGGPADPFPGRRTVQATVKQPPSAYSNRVHYNGPRGGGRSMSASSLLHEVNREVIGRAGQAGSGGSYRSATPLVDQRYPTVDTTPDMRARRTSAYGYDTAAAAGQRAHYGKAMGNGTVGMDDVQDRRPSSRNDYGQQRPAAEAAELDFDEQLETEMEKLLLDELYRLQLKSTLSPAEQRRYRAVRYELEFRRRMRCTSNNDCSPDQPVVEPLGEPHDSVPAVENDYSLRQQHRERYYEDAERQYQMMAARSWHSKQQRQASALDRSTNNAYLEVAKPAGAVTNQPNRSISPTKDDMAQYGASLKTLSIQNGNRQQQEEPPASMTGSSASYERAMTGSPKVGLSPSCGKPQVQFDSAPPAIYLVDTLNDDKRFMDLLTSASETHPVSGELEQIAESSDLSSASSSMATRYAAPHGQAKYVYQDTLETPRTQVIGGQEVYKDPRQERLKHLKPSGPQIEGEKLSFRDKMRLFAKELNEPTPKQGLKTSSAQREIESTFDVSR